MLKSLRRLFFGGLLIVVPAILTFLVLRFLFELIDGITRPIFEKLFDTYIPGTGLLATLIVIVLAGIFSRFFLGRQLYRLWEGFIERIPLAGLVYSPAKQLMESFTSDKQTFSDVVFIEYPGKDLWTVAFATRHVHLREGSSDSDSIVVFIPTTPTPLSGFTVLVPAVSVRKVNLTVEQAMRFVVSGGISCPDSFVISPLSHPTPSGASS